MKKLALLSIFFLAACVSSSDYGLQKPTMTKSDYINITKAQHVIAVCGQRGHMSREAQNIGTYLNENLRNSKEYNPSIFAQLNQQVKSVNISKNECKSYERTFYALKGQYDRNRMNVAAAMQRREAARLSVPRTRTIVQPVVVSPLYSNNRAIETKTDCRNIPGVGMQCTSRSAPESRALDSFFDGMRAGSAAYYGY